MSVRNRIADQVERLYDEKVASFFEEALEAQKTLHGQCPSCKRKVPIQVPDWTARTRALELMLEQGFGRPASGPSKEQVDAIKYLEQLEELSDEELALLAVRGKSSSPLTSPA